MIRQDLSERAKDFNLILDDVSITDLSFGREYAAAVESKQVFLKMFHNTVSKISSQRWISVILIFSGINYI